MLLWTCGTRPDLAIYRTENAFTIGMLKYVPVLADPESPKCRYREYFRRQDGSYYRNITACHGTRFFGPFGLRESPASKI